MGMLKSLCSIGFVICVAIATAVPSNAKALQERDSQCDNGPGWALPVLSIGGRGGTYYCETSYGDDYSPVSIIEVWRKGDGDEDGDRISGMRVVLPLGLAISSQLTQHRYTVHIVSRYIHLRIRA